MRRLVAFITILFLVLYSSSQYQIHLLEKRISYLEQIDYSDAEALAAVCQAIQRLQNK